MATEIAIGPRTKKNSKGTISCCRPLLSLFSTPGVLSKDPEGPFKGHRGSFERTPQRGGAFPLRRGRDPQHLSTDPVCRPIEYTLGTFIRCSKLFRMLYTCRPLREQTQKPNLQQTVSSSSESPSGLGTPAKGLQAWLQTLSAAEPSFVYLDEESLSHSLTSAASRSETTGNPSKILQPTVGTARKGKQL